MSNFKKNLCFLIVLSLFVYNGFSQDNAMQKIMKYVVSKEKGNYLYQKPDINSPVLVVALLPEPEDIETGDYMGTKLQWEPNYKLVNDTLIARSNILPVVCETSDWYQVFFTFQNEEFVEQSITAYVPKSGYVDAQLESINSHVLPLFSNMKASFLTTGKYRGYCIMWGFSESLYGTLLYIGKVIDGKAYFSNYHYYSVDSDNRTVTLYYDYEEGGKSLNLGKNYFKDNDEEFEADFSQITDEDLDLIINWYDTNYKMSFIQVVGEKHPYRVNIEALEQAKIDEVIIEPEFEGGQEALWKWWNSNFKLPKETLDNRVNGKTIVTFDVKEDGSISNIKMVRSVDFHLDRAIINTIKTMPKWKPGRRNGKPVSVKYTMPINIRTQ